MKILNWIARALIARARKRPYTHIDGGDYMERYWLLGGSYRDPRKPYERGWSATRIDAWVGRLVAVRVHLVRRSDLDRHLHDHPWTFIAVPLIGGYTEVVPDDQRQPSVLDGQYQTRIARRTWRPYVRRHHERHRIELSHGTECWSLFIMLRPKQAWGFFTRRGKVYWRDYLGLHDDGRPPETA